MTKYYSIKVKNNIIMSLFPHNSIKNLLSFKDYLKHNSEEINKYIQTSRKKK